MNEQTELSKLSMLLNAIEETDENEAQDESDNN